MIRIAWLVGSLALAAVVTLGAPGGAQARARHTTAAVVKTTSAQMLVDRRGMTLYVFAPDLKNKSVCYGKCAAFWPPVLVPKGTTVPPTLPGLKGIFGVSARTDGTRQLTYDGAPLYTFVKDKQPGAMTGQGLDVVGGYWWVVVAPRT